MMILPKASKSSGCAVVLEPGCCWPTKAFAATGDCDRVVVMHVDLRVGTPHLIRRIVSHSAEFERSGAKFRSAILACAGSDNEINERRLALARALLPLLTSGAGQLVFTSDPKLGPPTQALLELVGILLGELQGRSITFLANDKRIAAPAAIPRKESGVFLVDSEDYCQLEQRAWDQYTNLLEADDEAAS
jgi:hypothetical protein